MAVTLTIGGNARIDYAGNKSFKVKTTADGGQGVLDVSLIDPPTVPAVEDAVVLADGATTLYSGKVRLVKLRQMKTHVFVDLSCQNDADPAGLPTAAPFEISDAPSPPTSYGFRTLTLQTESTSGNIKTSGVAVIDQAGITAGMNVKITSANYGLTAREMTVQTVEVTYERATAPVYAISFGDPIVTLARIVREIPAGAITETMISDGAISTPKLQAYAVQTVSNEGATVTIDAAGITIKEGALNFPFPGGENLLLNSGFELGPYVAAPGSHTWTVATDWSTTRVRAATNLTEGTTLTMTASSY